MRQLYAKYSGSRPSAQRSGSESPATFETPLIHGAATPSAASMRSGGGSSSAALSSGRSTASQKSLSSGHTLDSFLTHYTSEDNNSFDEIIDAADRRLHQKFAVLYAAEADQAKQMALALALPDIERQFAAIEGPKRVETWSYKNKNYIMYVPDGVELTAAEQTEAAKRRMEIAHVNTRLQHNPFDERQSKEAIHELAKNQAKGMCGRIGVDGNYVNPALNGGGAGVRGFSFVKTPSPCPGVDQTPLMTWGEIEGTPFRLDGSDTPLRPMAGPSFRINETSRRETIALELADKACERKRGQKARAIEAARRNIGSPYGGRSTLERLATMSPAAKRLASGSRLGDTPSPRRQHQRASSSRASSVAGSPMLVRRKTPAAGIQAFSLSGNKATLMTDDLLKIPSKSSASSSSSSTASRKDAADFF